MLRSVLLLQADSRPLPQARLAPVAGAFREYSRCSCSAVTDENVRPDENANSLRYVARGEGRCRIVLRLSPNTERPLHLTNNFRNAQ